SCVVAQHVFRGLSQPQLSSDGRALAALDNGRPVIVDVERAEKRTIATDGVPFTTVAIGEGLLAAAGVDGRGSRWDLKTRVRRELGRVNEKIESVYVSPDGRYVIATGESGALHIFDDEGAPRRLYGHASHVRWLTFDPRGELVATGGGDGTVRLWS